MDLDRIAAVAQGGGTLQDLDTFRDARDSGKTFALAADGLYGLGVIGLGVGLVLFLTAEAEAPAEGQTLNVPVNVWFGQGAAGVDMTWRF